MKNALPILLFFVLFFTDFLRVQLHLLPEAFVFFPEFFYAIIAVIVISRIIARKSIKLSGKYILVFLFVVYIVIVGIALNEMSTITVISGIREYFKFLPIFLLPLAYDYSIDDLKKQFVVLISLGIFQLPVTIWQKFYLQAHGDFVTGTLNISNSLSIVMIGLIVTLLALYLKKIISLRLFATISIILFLPTTLNETRVTPVLLLISFIAVIIALWKELKLNQIMAFAGSGVFLLVVFVAIYNTLYIAEDGLTFADKMAPSALWNSYNYKRYKADPNVVLNLEKKMVGEYKKLPTYNSETGRIDSVLIPLDVFINNDVIKLFFGLGLNNAHSEGGQSAYLHLTSMKSNQTTLAQLLWETGILGASSFILFMVFVARDAFVLSKGNSAWNAFASGWFSITIVLFATLIYTNLFAFDELICLFMYFSGMVAVKRYMLMSVYSNVNPPIYNRSQK